MTDILLVDGPYVAHRSYYAPYRLTTDDGLDSTMIMTFLKTLNAVYKKFNPRQLIIAWESHGTTSWRKEEYGNYKMSRKVQKIPKNYFPLLADMQLLLHLMNIKQYYAPHNEADDVIAHFVKNHTDKQHIIYTTDKDMMQLVGNNCKVWTGKKLLDAEGVKEKYYVYPELIPDYLAIQGDTADNIEGIKNYGGKKAARILNKHGPIEQIPEDDSIHRYDNIMKRNKELIVLNASCNITPLSFQPNGQTVESILDKYQLNSIKTHLHEYLKMGKVQKRWF